MVRPFDLQDLHVEVFCGLFTDLHIFYLYGRTYWYVYYTKSDCGLGKAKNRKEITTKAVIIHCGRPS